MKIDIDIVAGVRSFLRSTIFAHPDDIRADEEKKTSKAPKKESTKPKKKKG